MFVTTYYLRSALDVPHIRSEHSRAARCGVSLTRAVPVSDLQVLVYFSGLRCLGCDPDAAGRRKGGILGAASRQRRKTNREESHA